jgi:hypothetical protein
MGTQGGFEMEDGDDLSPAAFNLIACDVRDGTADPVEACRAIAHCQQAFSDPAAISREMLEFVREAFARYLTGKVDTLDKAFGMVRANRGRRKADDYKRAEMASEVWRLRLEGMTHQVSLQEAAMSFRRSESVIGEAWHQHKGTGLVLLQVERKLLNQPWSEDEKKQMEKMLKSDQERLKRIFGEGWE